MPTETPPSQTSRFTETQLLQQNCHVLLSARRARAASTNARKSHAPILPPPAHHARFAPDATAPRAQNVPASFLLKPRQLRHPRTAPPRATPRPPRPPTDDAKNSPPPASLRQQSPPASTPLDTNRVRLLDRASGAVIDLGMDTLRIAHRRLDILHQRTRPIHIQRLQPIANAEHRLVQLVGIRQQHRVNRGRASRPREPSSRAAPPHTSADRGPRGCPAAEPRRSARSASSPAPESGPVQCAPARRPPADRVLILRQSPLGILAIARMRHRNGNARRMVFRVAHAQLTRAIPSSAFRCR